MGRKPKHAKPKTGFVKESKTYLNQVEILGGKGCIYTTPQSNGNYYFRTWVAEENKYVRKSLRTKDREDAILKGETEMLGILTKINQGHKIFGISIGEVAAQFLDYTSDRVETKQITKGRLNTITTQVNRWILPYIGSKTRMGEINLHSFLDYGMYRRKASSEVQDVTIRNEYTTVNALINFAFVKGYTPIQRVEPEKIKILEPPRRDTFTFEEYRVFYTRLRDWVEKDSVDSHEFYYRSLIRDFILIKSNSCCRFGELLNVQWKMTKVVKKKVEDGKTEKILYLNLPKEICKNRKSREFYSMGGRYLERLRERTEWTKPDDYVFSHRDKNTRLSKAIFYKYWKQLMQYTEMDKLDKKLSYYSLRHFGITCRLMAKVPIFEVSQMAGTNVQFIEQHYSHLDMSKLMDNALKTFKLDKDGFRISE